MFAIKITRIDIRWPQWPFYGKCTANYIFIWKILSQQMLTRSLMGGSTPSWIKMVGSRHPLFCNLGIKKFSSISVNLSDKNFLNISLYLYETCIKITSQNMFNEISCFVLQESAKFSPIINFWYQFLFSFRNWNHILRSVYTPSILHSAEFSY